MDKRMILFVVMMGLLMAGMAFPLPASAQALGTKVLIQVEGLSCPFCAFGLEKKLKKLPGVETVTIKVDEAIAEVVFVSGAVIDQNKIREAVEAGGFTPREIRILKAQTEGPVQGER